MIVERFLLDRPRHTRMAVVPFLALLTMVAAACGDRTDSASIAAGDAPLLTTATVNILEPADGSELQSGDVRVVLGADHITIVPAGDTAPNSGHHHLLLNVDTPGEGEPIPAGEDGYVHLGLAQTEHLYEGLAPGDYVLVAVIGDFAHRVIPQATDTVRFTVLAPGN